jgi:hypothetical protein
MTVQTAVLRLAARRAQRVVAEATSRINSTTGRAAATDGCTVWRGKQ